MDFAQPVSFENADIGQCPSLEPEVRPPDDEDKPIHTTVLIQPEADTNGEKERPRTTPASPPPPTPSLSSARVSVDRFTQVKFEKFLFPCKIEKLAIKNKEVICHKNSNIQHDIVKGTPCCRSVKPVDNGKLVDVICLDYPNSNLKNDIAVEFPLTCMLALNPCTSGCKPSNI